MSPIGGNTALAMLIFADRASHLDCQLRDRACGEGEAMLIFDGRPFHLDCQLDCQQKDIAYRIFGGATLLDRGQC